MEEMSPDASPVPRAQGRSRVSNDFGRDWPLHQRFRRSDGRDDALGTDARPSWRGLVHLLGLWIAVPAMTSLILFSKGPRATVGVSIYAVGLCAMFAASTTYHRWVHDFGRRAVWRRVDHAMIFAAIAGSSTPVVLIAIRSGWGVGLLAMIWATSGVGASFKLGNWAGGDSAGTVLYAVVSVMAALALPSLWVHGGVAPAIMYVLSGSLYIVGAFGFARTWPRLNPAVFSFHEVWHVFTVAAAAAHFVLVWWLAT